MSYFRTVASQQKLGVVLVGAGQMGQSWMRLLQHCEDVDLLGVVDIDLDASREALRTVGIAGVPISTDLSGMLRQVSADAVVNVTVPEAHFDINRACLRANTPVLCEKPLVSSLRQAYLLAGAAEHHATLMMASQSRRYYRRLSELRAKMSAIGAPFLVTVQFFCDPHFGGFRERMAQPLLIDMAIHAFDTARFLTGTEPVSVQCETFNPPWSWYDGDAAAVATFEMTGGLRFVYTGSWCSGGLPTNWNGSWRVSGPHGSATWDGLGPPLVERVDGGTAPALGGDDPERAGSGPEEIAGALAEFVRAVTTGDTPSGDVHSNVWTLAMVHAAVLSASSGQRVVVADLLDSAYREAVASGDEEASHALKKWSSPLARLTAGAEAKADTTVSLAGSGDRD